MNEIMINLVLNSVMAGLLVVTIVYCFKLNNRIRILQDSKNEFSKLIEQFDVTTSRAQKSIEELQNISKKVNDQLSGKLDKANFLADDLAFMIERGGKLADKIEGGIASGRSKSSPKLSAFDMEERNDEVKSHKKIADTAADEKKERKRALESMLNKVSAAQEEKGSTKKRRGTTTARLRSKAEQELYDALKSGNRS